MNLIDRYLGMTILQTIAIVLFAITGIELFIMLIGELGDIGHNHYTIFSALIFVLLSLPDQIYQLFPMAGLVGMLMAFGLLANHSELIILQSAGMSPLKITFSALKTILLLLLVISFVGEVIAPKTSAYANDFKASLVQSSTDNNAAAYDLWFRVNHDYLHVHEMDKEKTLHGLSWFHFDDKNNLLQTSLAKQAVYVNHQWVAYDIRQTIFGNNTIALAHQEQSAWPFTIAPNLLIDATQSPSNLSLHSLHQALKFNENNHSVSSAVQLAFWHRVIQPIASLVMMLLAIPFIFGPLRQASHSLRLVIGIVVGFCFYYANQFFGPIALLFHWSALLGALLPTFIFAIVGVLLFKLKRH